MEFLYNINADWVFGGAHYPMDGQAGLFLENLAVLRQWAGSYTMTPDGNPIVDETSVPGYYVSVAMCGHGFMLGPALGKYMADFMVNQNWQLDMSEFAFHRNFQAKLEAMK